MGENDYANVLELIKRLQDWKNGAVEIEGAIAAVPGRIEELEREIEEQKEKLASAETSIQEEKNRSLKLEADLASAQSNLSHYEEQVFKVKTNEQLWAVQKEIKFTQDKISDLETQIIESMEALDSGNRELEEATKLLERLTAENTKKVEELQQQCEEMKAEYQRMTEGQEGLRNQIPDEHLEQFDRILKSKGDVAIAIARDETCQACHVRIRPQTYMLVKNRKGIFLCDNCSRILYYEEEPPLENPALIS